MAENIKTIQLRMNTINKVSKITNAMKLVSMSKLQKYQNRIKEFSEIVAEYEDIPSEKMTGSEKLDVLAVCFVLDLGLVSGYNNTITKATRDLNPDAVFWIGSQNYEKISAIQDLDVVNEKMQSDQLHIDFLYDDIVDYLKEYQVYLAVPHMRGNELEVSWKYLNEQLTYSDFIIYEPDYDSANERFKQFNLLLSLYDAYYQSKYSENMTRRIAMEQATDNANDMREELSNRYNQLRQERITAEILELSAGVE